MAGGLETTRVSYGHNEKRSTFYRGLATRRELKNACTILLFMYIQHHCYQTNLQRDLYWHTHKFVYLLQYMPSDVGRLHFQPHILLLVQLMCHLRNVFHEGGF